MEATTAAGRLEALKENREMGLETGFNFGNDIHGAWRDMVKMKVVSGLPDVELAQI